MHGHASGAFAAGAAEPAYIKSLVAPGKTVLVVEYYDGSKTVVSRKGYASATGFRAISPTEISIDGKTALHLYGVEPCQGEMVNRWEGFAGPCQDFAQQQLKTLLKYPKVILCRAFLSEENAPRQDVTCFGYYYFPGSLDSISNFEEQLVAVGALRLATKPDGSLMRPDLADEEKIGRHGYGMWADPRTKR
ncbi:hypothetical protein ATY81_22025 [Rhizobium sp. R72]|nr:hypothetical protein ATY81_22025 [Rhizobium sp. R72]OWW02549.1 hypothetical protein ATY80_22025 [Rhizobium sp. R711]